MENQFIELGVSEVIVKSLIEMGFEQPTEVQSKVIPRVLLNEDLIVMSKTGSGKTAAFGIPLVQHIEKGDGNPKALILAPTRELAVQVESDLKQMAKHKKIRTVAVYGQHSMMHEVQAFEKGVDVVVGTPGRVMDHIEQGTLKTRCLRYLVLDEADRMLDMGFIDQVTRIIKKLPTERTTLLFSATMPPEIKTLSIKYMIEPGTVEIESETKTVDTIHQVYYKVEANDKRRQLYRIITVENPESCIVFCNTRMAVDMVNDYLQRKGITCKAIHGANSQSNRMHSMGQFKKGAFQVLVATDVAARGIHIDDLSLVVNFDVPKEKDSYVHRIGRTGRAGNGGKAITLVSSGDMYTLYEIEEHVGVMIQEEALPTDAEVAEKQKNIVKKAASHRPKSHHAPKNDNPKYQETHKELRKEPRKEPRREPHKHHPQMPPKIATPIVPPVVQPEIVPTKKIGFIDRMLSIFKK